MRMSSCLWFICPVANSTIRCLPRNRLTWKDLRVIIINYNLFKDWIWMSLVHDVSSVRGGSMSCQVWGDMGDSGEYPSGRLCAFPDSLFLCDCLKTYASDDARERNCKIVLVNRMCAWLSRCLSIQAWIRHSLKNGESACSASPSAATAATLRIATFTWGWNVWHNFRVSEVVATHCGSFSISSDVLEKVITLRVCGNIP